MSFCKKKESVHVRSWAGSGRNSLEEAKSKDVMVKERPGTGGLSPSRVTSLQLGDRDRVGSENWRLAAWCRCA